MLLGVKSGSSLRLLLSPVIDLIHGYPARLFTRRLARKSLHSGASVFSHLSNRRLFRAPFQAQPESAGISGDYGLFRRFSGAAELRSPAIVTPSRSAPRVRRRGRDTADTPPSAPRRWHALRRPTPGGAPASRGRPRSALPPRGRWG